MTRTPLRAQDFLDLAAMERAIDALQVAWSSLMLADNADLRAWAERLEALVYADEIPAVKHGDGLAWTAPDLFTE